jgi:cold shock CspA family protein
MRSHGTLKTWNEARAFGFIAPSAGGPDVFVHMSSMPRDGMRPRLGEVLTYEVEAGPDGRSRATRVLRPGNRASVAAASRQRRTGARRAKFALVLGVASVIAFVVVDKVGRQAEPRPSSPITPLSDAPASRVAPRATYRCDGRIHCAQMSSCEEATWVLEHCPDTRMDGDGDGVPCESQWCE